MIQRKSHKIILLLHPNKSDKKPERIPEQPAPKYALKLNIPATVEARP